jgi:ABC-type transport system involved in multi-copper enzyme maturation permease subunit
MAETLRGEILTQLCRHRDQLLIVLGLLGVFLLLTLVGFTVIQPGTSTYVINAMNFVGLGAFFLVFAALVVYCSRSGRAYQ